MPWVAYRLRDHLADRVGLGHVGVDVWAVPPYFAMYSLTISWVSAFLRPPNQPLGTKIPFSLPCSDGLDERCTLVGARRRDERLGVEVLLDEGVHEG